MRKIYFSFLSLFLFLSMVLSTSAQTRIDSSFAFQTDPAKKYSVYIPSGYDPLSPHTLMLGLHPFNTNRWDAQSWCDTLIVFAETNNLILVCPDGGADGKVDDAIDTAFTTALLDSMDLWYNIDPGRKFVTGFSWGGKTTYTYGLLRPEMFCGYLPIGAAVTISEVTPTMRGNARNKPVYIVHGSNDSPNTRYTPIRQALIDSGATLNSLLMPGVGHTIDFPNRNEILTTAFQWLDSTCTAGPPLSTQPAASLQGNIQIFPNPLPQGNSLRIEILDPNLQLTKCELYDLTGKEIPFSLSIASNVQSFQLSTIYIPAGIYLLNLYIAGELIRKKVAIQ